MNFDEFSHWINFYFYVVKFAKIIMMMTLTSDKMAQQKTVFLGNTSVHTKKNVTTERIQTQANKLW